MFFHQNAAQEEAQPVSGTTEVGLLPVVMTTEAVIGLDATEGANVAHGDNGDGMAVDPVVVPLGRVEPGSTGSGDGLGGTQTLLPASDVAMEEAESDNDEEVEEDNKVRCYIYIYVIYI